MPDIMQKVKELHSKSYVKAEEPNRLQVIKMILSMERREQHNLLLQMLKTDAWLLKHDRNLISEQALCYKTVVQGFLYTTKTGENATAVPKCINSERCEIDPCVISSAAQRLWREK